MRLEIIHRDNSKDKTLLLIPNKEESQIIDRALGDRVVEDNGLICKVEGEVRLSDGYGPHYISLKTVKKESPEEGCVE